MIGYGFGHDDEVPGGFQDADIEMRELEDAAQRKQEMNLEQMIREFIDNNETIPREFRRQIVECLEIVEELQNKASQEK